MTRRYIFVALLLVLLGVVERPAYAQKSLPASTSAPVDLPLTIAPPPVGEITLEVDARDNDLLGVVKELIRSLKGVSGKTPSVAGETKTATHEEIKSQKDTPSKANPENDFFQMLQLLELDEVLKGITHLHVVTIELPSGVSDSKSDLIGFYEKSFLKEENRRVLWSDKGNTQILMVASDAPRRHFSAVIQSGKNVTVVRADGYPSVEKLTKLFGLFF